MLFAMEKNAKEEINVLNFFSSPKWPNELRPLVAQHVTAKDLLVCRLICKEWHDQLQKEIFWKIKIPPQLLNSLSDFNDNYYRFFTRGGVRLIQTLDHVKIFVSSNDPMIECVEYLYDTKIGSDLGFRYLEVHIDQFNELEDAKQFISAALKFDCPYLVTPTKYFEEKDEEDGDDIFYIIFDNQFETLGEYLKTIQTHQYNEQLVTTLVRQLIQATQYLHARGFDLMGYEGVSFCIAKNNLNNVQLKLFNYGVNYMVLNMRYAHFASPERIVMSEYEFKSSYDFKTSNLFSLGAFTLYLSTGLPLYNVHPMRAMHEISKFQSYEIQDPNNELSDLAKDFVLRFLQRNPSDRMTLEEALNHPWLTNPDPSTTPLQSAYARLAPQG